MGKPRTWVKWALPSSLLLVNACEMAYIRMLTSGISSSASDAEDVYLGKPLVQANQGVSETWKYA